MEKSYLIKKKLYNTVKRQTKLRAILIRTPYASAASGTICRIVFRLASYEKPFFLNSSLS